MIILSVLLTLANDSLDYALAVDWIKAQGVDVARIEKSRGAKSSLMALFKRDDGCQLIVNFSDSSVRPSFEVDETAADPRNNFQGVLPLGTDLRNELSDRNLLFQVASTDGRYQFLFLSPVKLDDQGFVARSNYDFKKSGDDVLLERYARIVVARMTASFMSNTANITSGGISVPGLRSRDGKRSLGNLHDWTKKKGWSWTEDPRGFTTLRKGTDWAVVPLGGNKVKINGQWQELPDLVSEKDGDWYLSASGLTLLNGA
jgi:hypothetical protein